MPNIQNSNPAAIIVVILVADGVDIDAIVAMRAALKSPAYTTLVIAAHHGAIKSAQGIPIVVDCSFPLHEGMQFDALFIPGGTGIERLCANQEVLLFIQQAYKNSKIIASSDGGERVVIKSAQFARLPNGAFIGEGVINHTDNDRYFFQRFIHALTERHLIQRPDVGLIQSE